VEQCENLVLTQLRVRASDARHRETHRELAQVERVSQAHFRRESPNGGDSHGLGGIEGISHGRKIFRFGRHAAEMKRLVPDSAGANPAEPLGSRALFVLYTCSALLGHRHRGRSR
jgi:hypothetical protein